MTFALSLLSSLACLGGDFAPVDPATVWNREELYKVPKTWRFQAPFTAEVTPMWIEGEPYRGKPTRCFTLLGIPEGASAERKVPGIVLVHGGAGTAYPEWVRLWTRRGYAAITVDNCGSLPIQVGDGANCWMESPFGGPRGWGETAVEHVDEPLRDQWMYHAIAGSIRAHSYLRSLPCVDASNVGVTGISWGGFQTCILAAADDRFAYAVPVYGCGFNFGRHAIMDEARFGEKGMKWSGLWDPVLFLPYVKIPMLWVDGTNDRFFALDKVLRSAKLAKGESQFCTRLRMVHAHGAPGEAPAEILTFADRFARGRPAPVTVTSAAVEDARVNVRFEAHGRKVVRAELLWTEEREKDKWWERTWKSAVLGESGLADGAVSAPIPAGCFQCIVNLITDDGLIASSPLQTLTCEK